MAVRVPPFCTTDIGAEFFLLTMLRLFYYCPAVATADGRTPVSRVCFIPFAEIAPSAKGLYRIDGYVQAPGDLSAAFSHQAHMGNLFYLLGGHNNHSPLCISDDYRPFEP